MALPDELASLTWGGQEAFENAMLLAYSELMRDICARAALGMNTAMLRPNTDAMGPNGNWFPPTLIARAMVKMLRAEGLEAHETRGSMVFIRWPADPRPGWLNNN